MFYCSRKNTSVLKPEINLAQKIKTSTMINRHLKKRKEKNYWFIIHRNRTSAILKFQDRKTVGKRVTADKFANLLKNDPSLCKFAPYQCSSPTACCNYSSQKWFEKVHFWQFFSFLWFSESYLCKKKIYKDNS